MLYFKSSVVIVLAVICTWTSTANAQLGGSRAGVDSGDSTVPSLPLLSREVVEGFITIEGRAEVRVRPAEIRIVLAVTGEGQSADQCQAAISETITQLRSSWTEIGIPAENTVEDFIAVLPLYAWGLEKQGDREVGVEKKAGFRMQTNLHLSVPNDTTATTALKLAFKHGVTDIIAFDYWSRELDDVRNQARKQAVKAARDKADVLLDALFETRPQVINLQEQTVVRYPESLYHSFVNTHDEEISNGWRSDIPLIRAYRPRNTYYRGLFPDADLMARELPMNPEISVVSTVRLYFDSPAADSTAKKNPDLQKSVERE
ncbi:MAG: SIMPL domain-containing protein [Planctomyces sp.]|nr:SIMPL domain-containing protein [Planctomyces sp.]